MALCRARGVEVNSGHIRPDLVWEDDRVVSRHYDAQRRFMSTLSGPQKALFDELLALGFDAAGLADTPLLVAIILAATSFGIVVAVLMILTTRVVRYPWGIGLGWALQVVVALGAILVPSLGLVALIFGGMYGYATIKGAALDRRNAELAANPPEQAGTANGD